MNKSELELQPGFRRTKMSSIGGARTRHVATFVPSKASPGERIMVDLSQTKQSAGLVPGSLHLEFDLEIAGTKTSFLKNSSRGLTQELAVSVAGETLFPVTIAPQRAGTRQKSKTRSLIRFTEKDKKYDSIKFLRTTASTLLTR